MFESRDASRYPRLDGAKIAADVGRGMKLGTAHIVYQRPNKVHKVRAINRALDDVDVGRPLFYVDEADVDFNPRIDFGWMTLREQTTVPTPGKDEKHYLTGALHAQTGQVVWVDWRAKNAKLFVLLLAELYRRYRLAKTITRIADNYVIHKSAMTECFLRHHPKLHVLFQPATITWVNKIELLWKKLHDTVTRNHRYVTMTSLLNAVRSFMNQVSPFPGCHDYACIASHGWPGIPISYLTSKYESNEDAVG